MPLLSLLLLLFLYHIFPILLSLLLTLLLLLYSSLLLSQAKRNPVAVAQALGNLTRAAGKMKKANMAANKGGSPYAQSTIAGTHVTHINS